MVVDTSALVAIMRDELEADDFARRIADAAAATVSAVGYVELGLVAVGRHGYDRAAVDDLLDRLGLSVVAVTPPQARLALEAFTRFGKGRHPARLNFGDCFAYALAKDLGQPLLFKGDDFARTDVEPAA